MLSPARQGIVDAAERVTLAAVAVAGAEAASAMALAEAEAADQLLSALADTEHTVAVDLAERIKAAAASGAKLESIAPTSPPVIVRDYAQTRATSAHAAVRMLAHELEVAKVALAAAQEAKALATMAVVAEAADNLVAEMQAAFDILQRGHFMLKGLEAAAYTATAKDGFQRLRWTEQGRKFATWDLTPRQRYGGEAEALNVRFRTWRAALAEDPAAPMPTDHD